MGPVWGSDIDYSTHICLCAQRLSACLERRKRILQRRFYRCSSGAACSDECSSSPGVRFDLSLGVAYALDAVPMNLLSVSALMKEGATLHFEDHFENDEGNSWLQHPDMATRIMLEERRGLFVLPSSKLSGAVTVPDDEGQRVVGLCGSSSSTASASAEVDGESSLAYTQLGSALLTSVLYGQQDVGSDYGSREILSDAEVASMLGSLPSGESRLFFWAFLCCFGPLLCLFWPFLAVFTSVLAGFRFFWGRW